MDDILTALIRAAERCEQSSRAFHSEPIASMSDRLEKAIMSVDQASSGGWVGYHAHVYLDGFRPKGPGDHFDLEWGLDPPDAIEHYTVGPWREYEKKAVIREILKRADIQSLSPISQASIAANGALIEIRDEVLPIIDALIASLDDEAIKRVRQDIVSIPPSESEREYVNLMAGGRKFKTRDRRAMSQAKAAGGANPPPHIELQAWHLAQWSGQNSLEHLAKQISYLVKYLQYRQSIAIHSPRSSNEDISKLQSTFISYGGPDNDFARRLNNALLKNGVSTFFFAKDAVPGRKLHRLMREGINRHDRVILVCSRASLNRPGVLNEITETLQREARDGGREYLIPITIDDYVFTEWTPDDPGLAQAIKDRVVADFRGTEMDPAKFDEKVLRLVGALKK